MTTSLNVLCAICSEYFNSNSVIYSTTKCGHVFHQQCLLKWLIRSNNCPQCRANCHRHAVHRIFLNFSEPLPSDEVEDEPEISFDWCPLSDNMTTDEISKFGFKLDNDKNGDPLYAARVYLNDDLLPAYYVPKKKGVYCAWNCRSHFLKEGIEILDVSNDGNADYKWISAENGEIPDNALIFGYTETGENLYCSRTFCEGRVRYGKLHPSHGCCYVPHKEFEKNNNVYEVLVRVPKADESKK
ncbi:uncharacterized protein LOC142240358 [Haematobia irritans]|uniref:Putative e3 ubiquitin ligase n=1 Tax=Haematobia irritans TaxID=7368 RepID=A0A1L8EDX4_HAEIR